MLFLMTHTLNYKLCIFICINGTHAEPFTPGCLRKSHLCFMLSPSISEHLIKSKGCSVLVFSFFLKCCHTQTQILIEVVSERLEKHRSTNHWVLYLFLSLKTFTYCAWSNLILHFNAVESCDETVIFGLTHTHFYNVKAHAQMTASVSVNQSALGMFAFCVVFSSAIL